MIGYPWADCLTTIWRQLLLSGAYLYPVLYILVQSRNLKTVMSMVKAQTIQGWYIAACMTIQV